MRVYVSGPYSDGDRLSYEERLLNVATACRAGEELFALGHAPFVPHLSHYWPLARRSWDEWIAWCLSWVSASDALLRLPGPSRGSDLEVERARYVDIPVAMSIKAFRRGGLYAP